MKEKFKQTSIFSNFKRKFDIFKWQVRKSSREEPVLLGIKSTRTNCEVSDDFEYISSRGRDFSSSSDIYCSLDSDLCSAPPGHSSEDRRLGTGRNKISSNRKAENEIEIFERKFLRPLSSSSSSTRIVIKDGASTCHQPQVPAKVQSKVQSKVQPPVMSPPPAASQVPGGSAQPQHVRVLRTESKDSDCDSGAYSRSSSPEPIYERLDRSCEKLDGKVPLQSPNLVLSVIKENVKSKINSNLLLSCLNEAGKSSLFCSLDSLNQISSQPLPFKKNAARRKSSIDPPVTVTVGSHTHLSVSVGLAGLGCSKSETDLNKIPGRSNLAKSLCRSHAPDKYLNHRKDLKSENHSIKICDCQVTVNGQHICNLIY